MIINFVYAGIVAVPVTGEEFERVNAAKLRNCVGAELRAPTSDDVWAAGV